MEQKSGIEMNLVGGNNPCGAKEQARDESDRGEIIPAEEKSKLGMKLADGNNPCGAKEQARDETGRWK